MANSLGQNVTSLGYAGPVFNTDWAEMQPVLANLNRVGSDTDLRVSPVTGGTRQVSVAVGDAGSHGIHDHVGTAATVTLPTVVSGTKYFLIGLMRTWQTDQETTIVYVEGGTSATIPAYPDDPGVEAFQPLALVPLTAGQTVPGVPIDLRLVSRFPGDYIGYSELALQLVDYPGARVRIGSDTWYRSLTGWEKTSGIRTLSAAQVIVTKPGWSGGSPMVNRAKLFPDGSVKVHLEMMCSTSTPYSTASGAFEDTQVATLTEALKPDEAIPFHFQYWGNTTGGGVGTFGGSGTLYRDGNLQIEALAPGTRIAAQSPVSRSFRADFRYDLQNPA